MVNFEGRRDWVGFEVVTEAGLRIGWVKSVDVDIDNASISFVIIFGSMQWLSEHLFSIYELAEPKIIQVDSKRLIVAEDSIQRLRQLSVGLLERLGVAEAPWEQEVSEDLIMVPADKWGGHEWGDDNRGDDRWGDDNTGLQPAIKPRKPGPKPTEDAVEIPLE